MRGSTPFGFSVFQKSGKGFTLIEIIIAVAILLTIFTFGLLVSMETFRGSSFRSDRDLLVSLLQHARAQAMNNICSGTCTDGLPHGVHVDSSAHAYTAFQGSSYTTTDSQNQTFNEDPTVTPSGATDIVFAQLTGAVAIQKQVTLAGSGKTSVITVETNGRIWWTN